MSLTPSSNINRETIKPNSNLRAPTGSDSNLVGAKNKDSPNFTNGELNLKEQESNSFPEYSNYCKFLLVEELTLLDDFRYLHYGRCTVIGRLQLIGAAYILENLRLPDLPKEYQLPESACTIRLQFNAKSSHQLIKIKPGDYCEVLGEVTLMPKENEKSDLVNINSRYLIQLINLVDSKTENNLEEQKKKRNSLLSFYQKKYEPVIEVWFINRISRPSELITRNLEIRYINLRTE